MISSKLGSTALGHTLLRFCATPTVVRVDTNAVIGTTSEFVAGIGSRFAGTMISSGGDVNAAADAAFDVKSIVFDATLGGVLRCVEGLKCVCFIAGTPVAVRDGFKNIEAITVGDEVLSQNEKTGEAGYQKVVECFVRNTDVLVTIQTKYGIIETTESHPFYVHEKGWVVAGKLTIRDKLISAEKTLVAIQKIEHKECAHVPVYNFEVQKWHTYFVSEEKVLVHNECDGVEDGVENLKNEGETGVASVGDEGGSGSLIDIDKIRPQLKTEPDTAFFWSGRTDGVGGANTAADIAKSRGGVTLETTIDANKIEMPEWDFNNPSTMEAWDVASRAYAEQASGEIRAVVGSKLRQGNIWENVELPGLLNNPNVTKITIIDPKTQIETIIFKR